jgi:adenylate cyclase
MSRPGGPHAPASGAVVAFRVSSRTAIPPATTSPRRIQRLGFTACGPRPRGASGWGRPGESVSCRAVAYLEQVGGDGRKWELGLTTDIGRDPGSAVVLGDFLASRNHAEIRRAADGRFRIVDLNSRLGTYVAGQRISEHLLKDGDEVQVGTTLLRFVDPEAQDSAQRSAGGATILERRAMTAEGDAFPPADEQRDQKRLRADYERLRTAYTIGRSLSVEGGLDRLLERIAEAAIQVVKADRAAVLLLDPKTGTPVPRVTRNRQGAPEEVTVSRSILREVTTQGVGIISADAGSDSRFKGAQSVVASGMRSTMCVPLMHGGEVLGAIHCDTLLKTNVFRAEDLELFTSIASQAAVAVKNAMLLQRLQEEASARVQFQRFFSPGLVERIITGQLKVSQRGEVLPISVLFLDVRGFTRMSEGMEPVSVVELLNDYFERMVDILFRNDGTLDKYVGDEIMALFGAPAPLPDAPRSAVACAIEMRNELGRFNEQQKAAGRPTLAVGIGIHTGPALCGMFGSNRTRQYTAMGDTVNTAARLCSVAKGGQILISDATYAAVKGSVEVDALVPIEVKGKAKPVSVFDVKAMQTAAT